MRALCSSVTQNINKGFPRPLLNTHRKIDSYTLPFGACKEEICATEAFFFKPVIFFSFLNSYPTSLHRGILRNKRLKIPKEAKNFSQKNLKYLRFERSLLVYYMNLIVHIQPPPPNSYSTMASFCSCVFLPTSSKPCFCI